MTENTQRQNETGTGAGRHGGRHRARGWVMAAMLVGLGAAGGALTTIAVDAGAHGGWHDRFRMHGHGHGHGHAAGAAHATERLQRVSAWALGSVDATDEQRDRVDAILAGAVNDIFPLRDEHHAHRRDLIAELARPQVDPAELERVRAAELALAEKATARLLDATVAIAEVLQPEQRQQLAERFAERGH